LWPSWFTFAAQENWTMEKTYKHIFFDLDHTLWDFERSAEETKREMFNTFNLKQRGIISYSAFREVYVEINRNLWDMYRDETIGKGELNFRRFYDTLFVLGIDDRKLGSDMAWQFIEGISTKTYLFPFTIEILEYLHPKYKLHIITNGFEEVQFRKLEGSGMGRYFSSVITSEAADAKKPDPKIFKYALKKSHAKATDSLMVGDDLSVDMAGARMVGIDQLYVNHDKIKHAEQVTMEVFSLEEIMRLL
jgi:putative hydrolase of the HAD superfamily